MTYRDIIDFWFEEITPQSWWKKDTTFDQMLAHRFGKLHQQASQGELQYWRAKPQGRLAEVIVLDQFSRNIYRDQPLSFAQDGMALVLAQEAVRGGFDVAIPAEQRVFLYLPYMHSESAQIHQEGLELFEALGLEEQIRFERRHKAIIDRFGRYPHRNAILGRQSTPEEVEFLKQPGSGF